MKKRIISVLLLLSLMVSLMPSALAVGLFSQQKVYVPGQFADVPEGSTFEENVKTAYELGLMQGQREDYFGASSNLSRLAALIIACRLHSIYYTGADYIEQRYAGETKLEIYQNYALANGIFAELPDWSGSVTRSEFAQIISSALPDYALYPMNSIADDSIPDVPMDMVGAGSIYRLYRAGVLNGRDEFGNFGPELAITRNAACAIASRMASAPLRKTLTLSEQTKAAYEAWVAEQEALEAQRLQEAIAQVDTLHVKATVRYDATMYANDQLGGGRVGTVAAGTEVTYIDYVRTYSALIVLPDGSQGWVQHSSIRISQDNFVLDHDYTDEQKVGFVNMKGYSSETDYLIWISLSTQQVMVFHGAQGNWNLMHSFECASGANRTPTNGGVFAIEKKRTCWDFDGYYVNTVVVFNGGHAFHTRTYLDGGGLLDPTIGSTVSQGCIRMYDADVEWISENMPLKTTVVVF